MSIVSVLGRAFASNLRTLSVDSGEQSTLAAAGIQEPTIQRYFAWRRSLAMMVVLATLLSAGLATYCEFTETGDRLSGVQTRLENLLEDAKEKILPGIEEKDESEEESDDDEATSEKSSSDAKPDSDVEKKEPTTAFGQFADGVHLLSLYAMPLAAIAVLLCWTRLQRSFQILLTAFGFAFFVPMLFALCPWSWRTASRPPEATNDGHAQTLFQIPHSMSEKT